MKLIKLVILAILSVFLFSCASAPERIADTITGKPEVVINSTDLNRIKTQIIGDRLIDGYTVVKDTPYLLELQRQTKDNEDMVAYFMSVGNAYSTNYRTISVNFLKSKDSVRVVVATFLKAHMLYGQVNSAEITSNEVFNTWQKYLNDLKIKIEKN
jgi:hypothetical protein